MWLTRTNWNDGDQPTAADFNNFGKDIRTWGGTVDAGANPLVNLAMMRFNPSALPLVPSAGSFLYDIADSNLKFYTGSAWTVVGGVSAGLADPGANGILKRTGLLVTAIAGAGTDYYAPGHTVAVGDLPAAAVVTSGSYADPAWITSLAKSKVGLSAVENTALSTWAGSANITTIGTLVAGSVPWARVTGAPTIPTLVSQLTNDSGFLTAASSLAWAKITGAPTIPTLVSQLANDSGFLTASSSLAWAKLSGAPSLVNTFNTRSGAVTPASGDYTAAQVTNAVDSTSTYSDPAWITHLAWSKLTSVPSAFTPAAHASTHAAAGTDAISISGSQVSGNITGNAAGFVKGRITAISTQAISGVGGGMADPGSNGILKRTALNTTAIAQHATDYYAPGDTIAAGDLPTAAVVTSGSYSDPAWITHLGWGKLTSVPATFAPATHASAHAGAGGDPITSLGAVSHTGNLTFTTDNSYDIGASGATRPRNVYVAGAGTFGGTVTANQFTGSGAGISSGTIPIAAHVAGDYSSILNGGPYNITLSSNAAVADISFVIDGGGSAVTTGVKGDLRIDFACTINAWTLLADQSGSAVVNIWKVAYASFPATASNKITSSTPLTLSSAASATGSTLTGWTTTIAAGDCLRFNVDSASTCQRLVLCLKVTKS